MTTEELLSEPIEAARRRERSAFAELTAETDNRVVLFGAGTLGRKMVKALKQQGKSVLAFADNNRALHGSYVDDVPIISLKEAVETWGESTLFVTTIFHPTADNGMFSRLEMLRAQGCRRVVSFLPAAWMLKGVLPHFGAELPSRLLENAEALKQVAALWNDDASTEVFRQQLSWRLRGEFSQIGLPAPDQYFPRDIITRCTDEAFVDGGAFNGDTLRALPWPFRLAWAIEPDPNNLKELKAMIPNQVVICETALGETTGRTRFNAAGTMASACSVIGDAEVDVSTLNDLLEGESPTFLKLDIEGAELEALRGAREVLLRSQPVVAICVYHRPDDLWAIPLYIKELMPEHKFALRIHAHDGFELVFYAIPQWRYGKR